MPAGGTVQNSHRFAWLLTGSGPYYLNYPHCQLTGLSFSEEDILTIAANFTKVLVAVNSRLSLSI